MNSCGNSMRRCCSPREQTLTGGLVDVPNGFVEEGKFSFPCLCRHAGD